MRQQVSQGAGAVHAGDRRCAVGQSVRRVQIFLAHTMWAELVGSLMIATALAQRIATVRGRVRRPATSPAAGVANRRGQAGRRRRAAGQRRCRCWLGRRRPPGVANGALTRGEAWPARLLTMSCRRRTRRSRAAGRPLPPEVALPEFAAASQRHERERNASSNLVGEASCLARRAESRQVTPRPANPTQSLPRPRTS